jgi:ketosteroid isomerase-like protein
MAEMGNGRKEHMNEAGSSGKKRYTAHRCGTTVIRSGMVFIVFILNVYVLDAAGSNPQTQIRALLDAQAAAWNRGDIGGFMQGYWKSSQTTFVGSGGIERGWQALLDRYRRAYPGRAAMGTLTFSGLEIIMLGRDSALIVGHWQLVRAHDRPGGIFTLVARKFPEGWRIIHDHTSLIKPPAKP